MSSVPAWVPAAYASDVAVSAAKWGIRPELLAGLLQVESGFNPKAESSAGAEGIAQFEPGTAADYGVDPWDPASSIDGAAHLISDNIQHYGSETLALVAYNGGAGAVNATAGTSLYQQTRGYAQTVLDAAGTTGTGSGATAAGSQAGSAGGAATGNATLTQAQYNAMTMAQLNAEAHGISQNNETAGARIMKAALALAAKKGLSFSNWEKFQIEKQNGVKVDPTGKAYGWTGTQAEWDQLLDTVDTADSATVQHKGLAGAGNAAISSITDVVSLVKKIVGFFQNGPIRNRILLGTMGIAIVIGGVYFAMNGLDGGGGGGGTKIVPIPI